MRTTVKRPAVGKKADTQPPKNKKPRNVSAKAVAAIEQARLQEQKTEQERAETQLTDLEERAIMDIIVSAEDIVRGNNDRKKVEPKQQASHTDQGGSVHAEGVGKHQNESQSEQNTKPSNASSGHTNNNLPTQKDVISPKEKENNVWFASNTDKRADAGYAGAERNTELKDNLPAEKKPDAGNNEKKNNQRKTNGQKKDTSGNRDARKNGRKSTKQEKDVAPEANNKPRVKPVKVATRAMEYAAEFNKETEQLARNIKQARNTAKAVKKTGETTVKVVKKTAKGVAWLARMAIAALKGMVTALMIGGAAALPVIIIIVVLAVFISSPFSIFAGVGTSPDDEQAETVAVAMNLPESVLRYKPIVEKECTEQGIPQYVDVILAIMMQESGGRVPDVMQSSASMGQPNNSLQPEESIKQGVKYFKSILDDGQSKGVDFDACLQAYNFGIGFISYVQNQGGSYSYAIASQFSDVKAKEMGVARYGDKEYVPNVYRYLQGTGGVVLSDNPIGRHLNKLYAELYSQASAEASNLQGAEQSEVLLGAVEGDSTTSALEVLAVFTVRATIGAENGDGYTLGEIDDEQLQVFTNVFWDMHDIETGTKHKTVTETDEEGNETQRTVLVKTVTVKVKSTEEMEEKYNFDSSARGALNEMLTDYRSDLLAFVSVSPGGTNLSDAELAAIIRDLPAGDKGAAIVKVAFTRLGDPYSQDLRFEGRYIDCSGLTMWSYKQLGITIPGTAAEQGLFCVQNNVIVSRDALVPGDLVFYSDKTNGRYMNITHVAIYVGDGMIIDASYNRGQVVYRKMWGKPIMYGRPHIL